MSTSGLARVAAVNATVNSAGEAFGPGGGPQTPSQVSTAIGGAINSSGQQTNSSGQVTGAANPKDIVGNPANPIQIGTNPVTTTPVNTKQPSPTTVNATPATNPAVGSAPTTPSGLPGASDLSGDTANQASQAVDQLKQKYGKALSDITNSGVTPPSTPGAANAGIKTALDSQPPPPKATPTTTAQVDQFFDPEANPALQESTQQLMDFISPQATRDDLTAQVSKVASDQAELSSEKLQLMNVKNVMSGTADDLRTEVTAAGGFATESQIQALAVSRNSTLLKQATLLQDQVTSTQDLISNDTTLLNFEKDMANTQSTQRMGILNYLQSNQKDMLNAARTSLSEMQKTEGWNGVYQAALASGDPTAIARINSTMGAGFDLATAAKNDTTSAKNVADLANTQANTANTRANTQKTLQETNDASGVPNPAKANAPGYNETGVKYTNASAQQEVQAELKNSGILGTRNLIPPAQYNQYKAWWVTQGLKDTDFDSLFGGQKDTSSKVKPLYN